MSILVTGGAGFIGSHMVLRLVDAGEEVVVLDNLSTGFDWAVSPKAHLVVSDCGDRALVGDLIRKHAVDAIVHFAASVVVADSLADPLGYYLNNTVRSHALIGAAVEARVRHFVFSSTAAVYGDPALLPVGEDAPLKPLSPYGRSKRMTESMLADTAAAHDFSFVTLRYFNVAGADPLGRAGQSTRAATNLVKVACEAALGKRDGMTVFGADYPTPDGTCIRDYIHVSDLVAAHGDALAYLRAGGKSLTANCGYGRGVSVLEVIEMVKQKSGRNFPVRNSARRPGDPVSVVASAELIAARLGWRPIHAELGQIIEHSLRWENELLRRGHR